MTRTYSRLVLASCFISYYYDVKKVKTKGIKTFQVEQFSSSSDAEQDKRGSSSHCELFVVDQQPLLSNYFSFNL